MIADGEVRTEDLADGAVTSSKLDLQAGLVVTGGVVSIAAAQPSTSASTGALVVSAGGVGVAGSVHVGETVNVGHDLQVGDSLRVDGASTLQSIATQGNVEVGGALQVDESAVLASLTVTGTTTVTGASTFDDIRALGDLEVSGTSSLHATSVDGAVTVSGGVTAQAVTTTSGAVVGGALSVGGTTDLQDVSFGVASGSRLEATDRVSAPTGSFTSMSTTGGIVAGTTLGVSGHSTLQTLSVPGHSELATVAATGVAVSTDVDVVGSITAARGALSELSVVGPTTTAALTATDSLVVGGPASLAAVSVSGSLEVLGATNVRALDVDGTLSVAGPIHSSSFSTAGTATIDSTITVQGDTSLADVTFASGSGTSLELSASIQAPSANLGDVTVGGDATVTGGMQSATVTAGSIVSSGSFSAATVTAGHVASTGALSVTDSVTADSVSAETLVIAASASAGSLVTTGNVQAGGDLAVVGDTDIGGWLLVQDVHDAVSPHAHASLRTLGGLAVGKSAHIGASLRVEGATAVKTLDASGIVHITNDADASGANSTASLHTDGGVAIARHLVVGEGAEIVGSAMVTEHLDVGRGLTVANDIAANSDVLVAGGVTSSTVTTGSVSTGTLSVSGETVLAGSISLTSHDGDIVTTGDGDIGTTGSGDVVTTGTGDIRTVSGNILGGGDLYVVASCRVPPQFHPDSLWVPWCVSGCACLCVRVVHVDSIIDGSSVLKQGALVEGTSTQAAPTFVVRDHEHYGGFGLGHTVRLQVGDPTTAAHYIMNSPGTALDAIDIDSAGGVDMDVATTAAITAGDAIHLSSDNEIRSVSAGPTLVKSTGAGVYVAATAEEGPVRRLAEAAAVSSDTDDGSIIGVADQDVVLVAGNTIALASDQFRVQSTSTVRATSDVNVEIAAHESLELLSNRTMAIRSGDTMRGSTTNMTLCVLFRPASLAHTECQRLTSPLLQSGKPYLRCDWYRACAGG